MKKISTHCVFIGLMFSINKILLEKCLQQFSLVIFGFLGTKNTEIPHEKAQNDYLVSKCYLRPILIQRISEKNPQIIRFDKALNHF